MLLLYYLYGLGVISLLFEVLWKWVIKIPIMALLAGVGVKSMAPIQIMNVIGYYLMASFAALYGIGLTSSTSSWYKYLILILGGILIGIDFMDDGGKFQNDIKGAGGNISDSFIFQNFSLSLFGLIIYPIAIIFPTIAINPASIWFLSIMKTVTGWPVIGLIIGIIGVIYVISFVFTGVSVILVMLGVAYNSISNKKAHFKCGQ